MLPSRQLPSASAVPSTSSHSSRSPTFPVQTPRIPQSTAPHHLLSMICSYGGRRGARLHSWSQRDSSTGYHRGAHTVEKHEAKAGSSSMLVAGAEGAGAAAASGTLASGRE
jgi:IS5 family transposase